MKKISLKEYRTHIFLAIGAAILVSYFESILNLLGRAFIYIGNSISSQYLDSLYRDIAAGRTDYVLLFSNVFYFMLVIVLLFSSFGARSKYEKHQPTKTDNDKNVPQGIPMEVAVNKLKQNLRIARFVSRFLSIISSILISGTVISSNIKYSTINSFEQKVKILTPYISAGQKDLLISKFSSMASYNDYITLDKTILAIAKEKNISLPKQAFITLY